MIQAKHTNKEHIFALFSLIFIPSFLTIWHIIKIVSQSWEILLPTVFITRLRRKLFPLLSRGEKPIYQILRSPCLPQKEYKLIWYTNTNSLQLWDFSSHSFHIYVRNIDLSSLLRIDGQIIVDSLAIGQWFEYWHYILFELILYILYLCACLFTLNSQPALVLTRCSWNNS